MSIVVERYVKWWKRESRGMRQFPAKILADRLRGLPPPTTAQEARDHIEAVLLGVGRFMSEHPSLVWPRELSEGLRGWGDALASIESIRGASVADVVDAFVSGIVTLEEGLALIHE